MEGGAKIHLENLDVKKQNLLRRPYAKRLYVWREKAH